MRNLQNLVSKYATPASDPNFPDGSAKDDVTPGDKTGTELVASWVNELLQYAYALIRNIGDVPNNVYERPGTSQMVTIFRKWLNRDALCNFRDLQTVGIAATKTSIERNVDYFVVCGGLGLIRTSFDGENWIAATSGTVQTLNDIEFDETNLIFVIVGNSGVILTATDPTGTWTSRSPSPEMTGQDIFGTDSTIDGSLYANCGEGNTNVYAIDLSFDQGVTWVDVIYDLSGSITGITNPPFNISVKSGVGICVGSGGEIARSPNAASVYDWAVVTTPTAKDLFDVDFSPLLSQFGVVGEETLWTSEDLGLTWTDRTASLPVNITGETLYGINWIPEANVWLVTGTNALMFISADGENWKRVITTGTLTLYDSVFKSTSGTGIACGTSADCLQSASTFPHLI